MTEAAVGEVIRSAEAGGSLPSQIMGAIEKVYNAHGREIADGMAPRGGPREGGPEDA